MSSPAYEQPSSAGRAHVGRASDDYVSLSPKAEDTLPETGIDLGNFMFRALGKGECLAFFPLIIKGKMVLQERIELSTSPLSRAKLFSDSPYFPYVCQTPHRFRTSHCVGGTGRSLAFADSSEASRCS
jgi:hypothetical protein